MNWRLVGGSLAVLVWAGLEAPATAQPVSAEAAMAAGLRISTADPRLAIYGTQDFTYTYREPETDSPAVVTTSTPWSGSADIIRRLWARAGVSGQVLTTGSFRAIARGSSQIEFINGTDDTIRIEGWVDIPDADRPDSPGPYFYQASHEEGATQYARIEQGVRVLTGGLEGLGDEYIHFSAETRPALDYAPGPGRVDAFGVPFSSPFVAYVPPSFTVTERGDEVIIEIATFGVRLVVEAEAQGVAVAGTTSAPLVIDVPRLRRDRAFLPMPAPLARFCRAGGGGSGPAADAPICACFRDEVLRSQRCRFTFADVLTDAVLPAALREGEVGDAAWTFRPAAEKGGVYQLVTTMFGKGGWVPVDQGKVEGKYVAGDVIKGHARFTAPDRPTILRTELRRWPEGAKKPIVSTSDAFVALRKPKGK